MPGLSSQGIFLSYRREDAAPNARLLKFQLAERFPDVQVFMDLDSIEPGQDFAEVIEDAVNSCAVLVALIGRRWATLTDEEGARRLDNPDDYVRFEVKTALERGVQVIPVLIDDAKPPRQRDLPADLHKLARLSAAKLSYDRYQADADLLFDLIQRLLAKVAEQSQAGDQVRLAAASGTAPVPLADAERIANSITDELMKASALSGVAEALAATEPDRAERIANSITDEFSKVSALSGVAKRLAATNPGRAERNANSITANSITDKSAKAKTLSDVAEALAATDPDRAERIANSITCLLYTSPSPRD